MNVQIETKNVVSVSEMARMVGLSRSRFYQLIGTTFPEPLMDDKKRPYYSEELQAVCVEMPPPKLRGRWQANPFLRSSPWHSADEAEEGKRSHEDQPASRRHT